MSVSSVNEVMKKRRLTQFLRDLSPSRKESEMAPAEFIAEELESRVLYSGSPILLDDLPAEVGTHMVDEVFRPTFEPIDSFLADFDVPLPEIPQSFAFDFFGEEPIGIGQPTEPGIGGDIVVERFPGGGDIGETNRYYDAAILSPSAAAGTDWFAVETALEGPAGWVPAPVPGNTVYGLSDIGEMAGDAAVFSTVDEAGE